MNGGKEITIGQAIKICLDKNLLFAAYRIPNLFESEIVIQSDAKLQVISGEEDYSNLKGFLVAPFSHGDNYPPFVLRPDLYAANELKPEQIDTLNSFKQIPVVSNTSHIPFEISHQSYITQVTCIVNQIQSGTFEKVVPSRIKLLKGRFVKHLPEIFELLCKSYPNAFVYIFNAGPHLWIGATPEPLLKSKNGSMHTVSLAGTRPYSDRNLNIGAWNSKERLEQEYVTRYISKVLSKFNLKDVELEGPYAKKAGNLVHLRTDFSFNSLELRNKLKAFLESLHPTPAVCGMPRIPSLQLIRELEVHQREYYSGYLGPIGLKDRLALFVNLRCMKVLEDVLSLYVGGGITADSLPEDEWQETEIKAETLLSVIQQITV